MLLLFLWDPSCSDVTSAHAKQRAHLWRIDTKSLQHAWRKSKQAAVIPQSEEVMGKAQV